MSKKYTSRGSERKLSDFDLPEIRLTAGALDSLTGELDSHKAKDKQVDFRINGELFERARSRANAEGMSFAGKVDQLLRKWLDEAT